jgi:hypothetical protein
MHDLAKITQLEYIHWDFYLVTFGSGFDTTADREVATLFPKFSSTLPIEHCLAINLVNPDEISEFKTMHSLSGKCAPLLILSEEPPFSEGFESQRVVIELGRLHEPDKIRQIFASIADNAHTEDFIVKSKRGEILRKIEYALGRYGPGIKDCLSLIGFG